jgi:hypothetical protein
MFNSDILKKIKKDIEMTKSLKEVSGEATKTMMPEENESEDEMEEMGEESKKESTPEAKIEIELMIQGAKKKKK